MMEQISGYDERLDRFRLTGCYEQRNDGAPDIHFSFEPGTYQQDTSDTDSLGEAAGVSDQMCALEDLPPNPMAADVPYTPSISVAEAADWSRLDFEGFSAICARQEIVLPKGLHDIASAPELPSIHTIAEPSGMFAAIGAVTRVRRRYPDAPLISKQIDISAFGDNVPALAIANMLNASLRGRDTVNNTSDEGLTMPTFALGRKAISSCDDAEYYFARQLDVVPWIERLVSVVFEEGGSPVFYRKTYAAESAITLTDVIVGGTVFGKGYLMRVEAECDEPGCSSNPRAWSEEQRSFVYPTSKIIRVTPMRPTAFGLPPEQRAVYFSGEAPTSKQVTVDDFIQRSQEIVFSRRNS